MSDLERRLLACFSAEREALKSGAFELLPAILKEKEAIVVVLRDGLPGKPAPE